MTRLPWYDIEMRGRKLDAISRQMNTKFWNHVNSKNQENYDPQLALSYLDRIIKIENSIQPYVEAVIGVKAFLKKAKKVEQL